jgi:hypothetical protein
LETRRLRRDLIEVFKIFNAFDDLVPYRFFDLNMTNTRGHSSKVLKPRCLDIRTFSFSHRIVDIWNSLDDD